jgi:hypothetical protein
MKGYGKPLIEVVTFYNKAENMLLVSGKYDKENIKLTNDKSVVNTHSLK